MTAKLAEDTSYTKTAVKKFMPPTREEIRLEAAEIGLTQHEADRMYYFYESKGWMVGKNLMKSWKSALQGWRLRWLEQHGFVNQPKPRIVLPTRPPAQPQGVPASETDLRRYAEELKLLRGRL